MTYEDLTYEMRNELACNFMAELVNDGRFGEYFGADYDAPSWHDVFNAYEIVGDKVLRDEYGDVDFTEDDFFCCTND